MSERQNVKVTIHDQSVYGSIVDGNKYEPDTINDLIEWLGEKLQEVPPEFRDTAKVEVDSVGGYEGEHHSEIAIFYSRPETDEEMNIRISRSKQRLEEEVRRHEQYAAQARAALQRS